MPELFGSGVAIPTPLVERDWPIWPFDWIHHNIPALGVYGLENNATGLVYIINAIEVMSDTGPGGDLFIGNHVRAGNSVPFLYLNIGAGPDAFSWRGLLYFFPQDIIQFIEDGSGTATHVTVTGFATPQSSAYLL